MIAFIEGTVEEIGSDGFVLGAGGVGYYIQTSASVLSRLSGKKTARAHTKMIVREDDVSLVGFLERDDLALFNLLTGVTGVGAKAALSLLGTMNASQLTLAILTDDTAALSKAPGVGKKIAQRLSLELRDKIAGGKAANVPDVRMDAQQSYLAAGPKQDAAEALCALGYSRGEAMKAVLEVALEGMDAGAIIKLALKKLTTL